MCDMNNYSTSVRVVGGLKSKLFSGPRLPSSCNQYYGSYSNRLPGSNDSYQCNGSSIVQSQPFHWYLSLCCAVFFIFSIVVVTMCAAVCRWDQCMCFVSVQDLRIIIRPGIGSRSPLFRGNGTTRLYRSRTGRNSGGLND